jgi:uncharacterized protein Yka (UPF0111/DUF47 family)
MFSLQTIFGSGKQFYLLLDEAASAAYDSAKALHVMMKATDRQPALDAFKLARQRERTASDKIGQALVESFITPIEREDIEALGSALYKIPKQIEKFADRYALATMHLEQIDFAPRAAMLEQAAGVVVEMVHELERLNIDSMTALNDKLRSIENEADRLMLELYREIYSGRLTACRCSCSRNSSRSWRKPSTVAARPAWSRTRSCSRTADGPPRC